MTEMEAAGATHVNGSAATKSATNPYETNPNHIPNDDPFISQSAQYGRYAPRADDFTPRFMHWYQSDPVINNYWEQVAQQYCTPEHSLNISGSREGFAAGSIIIWVDRELADGAAAERYSAANTNERLAAQKAEESLREIGVSVPVIFFCGTIEGRNVTIESRIAGVSLEVAWRYLDTEHIEIIKNQCRQIIQRLGTIELPAIGPSYVCHALNAHTSPSLEPRERDILFTDKGKEEELCFTHNDLVQSNIILQGNRVVGIAGWRQGGYFGTVRAKKVHRLFRNHGPASQSGGTASWADLYDGVYDANKGPPLVANQDTPLPSVKTEPTTSALDKFSAGDYLETNSLGLDGTGDYATSKTLANLKQGLPSRASSTDRSSPATSVKVANKKPAHSTAKKGTAKKPAAKKRKGNDPDADSVDGGRSNTPISRASKTPGRKQSSVSIAGSPAPEEKKKPQKKKKGPKAPATQGDDDSDSFDENAVFCICRRPDNHTWMIGCDADCDDWYHGKCVNIDPRDAELIDRYICKSLQEVLITHLNLIL